MMMMMRTSRIMNMNMNLQDYVNLLGFFNQCMPHEPPEGWTTNPSRIHVASDSPVLLLM